MEGAGCRRPPVARTRCEEPFSTSALCIFCSEQDLVVIVKPTGKVLLNKVTGNISNGLYAIMVRKRLRSRSACPNAFSA